MMNQTKKHTTGKKLLALLLALIMTVSLLPMSVFAADLDAEETPVVEDQPQQDAEPAQEPDADSGEEDADTQAMEDEVAAFADTEEEVTARDTSNDGFIRIFHLDCGRKYFSVSEIEGIIDQLAENHYTHIQLAFGNDGFRFLLSDMEIEANGTTYSSTNVRNAITSGNSSYSSGENTASTMLSESDMDTIIGYAQKVGISVIPMLNTPGHMHALVSAMKTLGIRSSTGSEMSLTSEKEVNFIKALQQKYITYFAGKGSDHYNLAADEYSFSGLSSTEYTAFAQYVNDVAKMVKKAGMTPMAYNDGIYYSGKTTSVAFDTDIQICYWSQATNYASVTDLANKGFAIINNNDAWYYVLGDYLYEKWSNGQWGYENAMTGIKNTPVTQAKNAADKAIDLAGSVLCCWCDGPHIGYTDTAVSKGTAPQNQTNQESVYALIKAMADANPDYFKAEETPAEPELVVDTTGTVKPAKQEDGKYAVTVKANDTVKLKVNNVADTAELTWESDNESVAKVANGLVTFTGAAGTVKITATLDDTAAQAANGSTVLEATFEVEQDTGEVPVTENKTITVTIGGTATDTISGANYSGKSYQTKDTTIAKVESVTGTDATESVPNYVAKTGYVYNISNTWAKTWTKTDYYYKIGENYYPCYVKYQNSRYYWGYSVNDSATSVTEAGNSWYLTEEVTVYSLSGTASKPASTTIVFKGVAKGTTEVTIGNTHYTINVVAEDLTNAATLPIQLWITNNPISFNEALSTTGTFNRFNNDVRAKYLVIEAGDAYGEKGVPLSTLVPEAVTSSGAETTADDRTANYVLWKGTVLTKDFQQVWTEDRTLADSRTDYQYVRYFGGAWAVSADLVNWTTVTGEGSTGSYSSCKEQVIAYYMQRTDVTKEVITDVVDWGNTTETWAANKPTQYVVLDFAVQYPDQRVPNSFPVDGKTVYYHCSTGTDAFGAVLKDDDSNYYRRIGLIKGIDTTNYEVYMITVTPTSDTVTDQLTNSSTALTKDITIKYNGTEKVAWVDDEANLPANFRSDDAKFHSISGKFNYNVGGDPNVEGLEIYQRQGMLVTYYLRAKVNKDTLHVHYIDKIANVEFHSYDINVFENTVFDKDIGLGDPWKGPLKNGSVRNDREDQEVYQTVSADLSTMPAIGAQYRFGNYKCEEVVRSDDGKDVYLYYTFVAEKTFVVDFGLPLNIKPTDVSAELKNANITAVQYDKSYYATITEGEKFSINYTLNKTIDGVDNFQIVYKGTNLDTEQDGTATFTIRIIPASTVYYEDDDAFVKFSKEWTVEGKTATDVTQALDKLGDKATYGFDKAYEANQDSTLFSMGSAHKVTVRSTDTTAPNATFTFTGTGFDLVSLTSNTTGTILVDVYQGDNTDPTYRWIVDTFYGYTRKDDGYLKNTWTYGTDNKWHVTQEKVEQAGTSETQPVNPVAGESRYVTYEPNYIWTVTDGDNALYQIPVIHYTELPYDTYTVVVTPKYFGVFDHAGNGSYDFYLDGVRIYNPMQNGDTYYTQDGEGYATFTDVRDLLLDANDLDATTDTVDGAVFVDGVDKADITDYKNYGPNNEVYLSRGQAIAFKVKGGTDVASVQLGAKAPNGSATLKYKVGVSGEEQTVELSTSTDMYYKLKGAENGGTIVITNSSDATLLLALSNLKITYKAKPTAENSAQIVVDGDVVNEAPVMLAAMLNTQPEPEPEVFVPERFEAGWNRSTVKVGQKATLTVKTSTDVDAITVDGVSVTNYRTRTQRTGWGWNATRVTYREFTYTITAAEAGTLNVSVAAVNAEGTVSEPITAALTVQAAAQRPGIGGWLDNIFGRWF